LGRGVDGLVLKASRWVFDRARLCVVAHRGFKVHRAHCPHDGAGSLNMTPAKSACLRYAALRGCGTSREMVILNVRELQSAGLRNVCDLINSAARVTGLQSSSSCRLMCLSTSLTLACIYRDLYTRFLSYALLAMNTYSQISRPMAGPSFCTRKRCRVKPTEI
jgi:hypothetical protein